MRWKQDHKDTFEKVEGVVDAILDTVDDTPLVLSNALLKDLVDGEVHEPETKSSEDDAREEDGDRAVGLPVSLKG